MRKIIHLDLDAFFCAVEENRDPGLRRKAFAVGGRPEERGVVASCSYPARAYGVRSAMPMSRALRLCPQLIVVPGHFNLYRKSSRQVMERLHSITPLVEQISIDEAFLDVTDLAESAQSIAQRLQAGILSDLGLPCSLGVSTNKLVAKIATDTGKAHAPRNGQPPNAILVVKPGEEAAFLAPLPVESLWGVGPKTAVQLTRMGIRTVGDLADTPESLLLERFGRNGHDLARRARGLDDHPLSLEREIKSMSRETTFSRDIYERQVLLETLRQLSEEVTDSLQKRHLEGGTVKLKLRWSDFTTLSRQATLRQPAARLEPIWEMAQALFLAAWDPGRGVRLVGVGISSLSPHQLQLWEIAPQRIQSERERKLQSALRDLRHRFGEHIIQRGGEAGADEE